MYNIPFFSSPYASLILNYFEKFLTTEMRKVCFSGCLSLISDVEIQTTDSPHRAIHPSNSGNQSLINTPFSRDPKVPVYCPVEESHRNRVTPGFQTHTNNRNPVEPNLPHNHHSVRRKMHKMSRQEYFINSISVP